MSTNRIRTDDRRFAIGATDKNGHARKNVLEHRHAVLERTEELHPQFRQRTAGNDGNSLVDPGLDQRRGKHERVNGPGAERLHVTAGCVTQPCRLRNRLAERAAAPLVAVADRLFATADHILNRVWLDAVARKQ